MKKVFVLFLLLVNISFSLKVISVEPIDFGSVIKGENSKLEGVKIEVRGSSGKKVLGARHPPKASTNLFGKVLFSNSRWKSIATVQIYSIFFLLL